MNLWYVFLMQIPGKDFTSTDFFEKWMKKNNLNYAAVASACGIPEDTVREWISQKDIPKRFLRCLAALARSRKERIRFIEGSLEDGFRFGLSMNDYAKLARKALDAGCSVEELVANAVASLARPGS